MRIWEPTGVARRSRAAVVRALVVAALAASVYAAPAAVRIDTVEPTCAAPGDGVTITGIGFGARNVQIVVDGVAAEVMTANGHSATFIVPPGVAAGFSAVNARNPGAGSGTGSIVFQVKGPELCNGIDDDCDGEVDEGLGDITCGIGACTRTVAACADGTPQQCVPGNPKAEICGNGIDEDCDGADLICGANAGEDFSTLVAAPAHLDGSASHASPGDLITFHWSLVQAPDGSAVSLSDPTRPDPQFTPDLAGLYLFELVVNSGGADSPPDQVMVTAFDGNTPPNARAGRDLSAPVGATVALDGSASDDPNGTPVTFLWTFVTVPAGSALTDADIALATTATSQFVPDVEGTYVLKLQVSDGTLSADDTVQVFATAGNVAPRADAGPDFFASGNTAVALDGSGSVDPDAAPAPLTFAWTLVSRPPGSTFATADILGADTPSPTFTPDVDGSYVFRLTVSDGDKSDGDNVLVLVDGVAPSVQVVTPVNGSTITTTTPTIYVSYNDSESGVDVRTYRTELDGVDITASAMVTDTYATYNVVSPLSAGSHTVVARIKDRAGNEGMARSDFTVSIFRAIADCAPRSGTRPLTVTFRTRGEFSGGSIVRYRWDYQGDGIFDTSEAVASDHTFTFQQKGHFVAVLEVTNNLSATARDTCPIDVEGNKPTASANANPSNGPVPLVVNFTCTGNDADGTISLYEWDFDGDGVFDYSSTASGNTSHTYDQVGMFTATCRVTDNDGQTATARTTTTAIRPAPPGSPSVLATASPGSGNAPLTVSFNGSATDDGTIVLWEWDFDGDGVFDYSSPTSPATTFRYVNGGIFAAALRATDNTGLTGTDTVEVVVNITASLSIPDDTIDPTAGETAAINTSIGGGVPVRIFFNDRSGATVRTLVNATRAAGNYSDPWDGKDDAGQVLPQAPYFAILEYNFGGEIRRVDLTNSTGGSRYNPSRNSLPPTFKPFEDDLLTINFTIPASQGASEIQAFIGLFNTDTRFVTLLDRVPLGVGTHTIKWDGLDSNGNFAVPPPGDAFLFGIFGFRLPDNAVFLQEAPVLSNVTVDPNFFDPSTPSCLTPAGPTATIQYDLNKVSDVELTVTRLSSGLVLRRIRDLNVPAGTGRTAVWDGRTDGGLFADSGDYRLALQAIDSTGSASLTRYALMRVFY